MRNQGALLMLFLAVGSTAIPAQAQDSLVSIGDEQYLMQFTPQGPITYLKYPVLGCPALVPSGGTGKLLIKLPLLAQTPDFTITIASTGDPVPLGYTLPVLSVAYNATYGLYEVTYHVPSQVARDTYDVTVTSTAAAFSDQQPNCLRVLDPTEDFTFVVLADTHFNDPRAWWGGYSAGPNPLTAATVIPQIKQELRALNPTFVLVAGDMGFGWNYNVEYPGIRNTWKDLGIPVFMVPGNHDGQACIVQRKFLGIVSPVRDGLKEWRRYLGPLYYSFGFGGLHFQGVNSFDGPPQRRDGFLIVVENYGGDLWPEQMGWIQYDVANASGPVVPWMHHPAYGPYRPNKPFGMTLWVIMRILEFLTTGNLDDFTSQGWNTQATGQWLMAQYEGTAAMVFIGHTHEDTLNIVGSVPYVGTTSARSEGVWGYRIVRAEDGQIVDYVYTSQYPSIPAGNLKIEALNPNNGTQSQVKFKITSGLAESYDLTLEVALQSDPNGYTVEGGWITAIHEAGSGIARLWVKAPSPSASSLQAPSSVVVQIAGATPPAPPPPAPSGPPPACGSTAGNASDHTSVGPARLLMLLAAWLILLAAKRRRCEA